MKRLDQVLVDLGLVPSRTKAQQLIKAGEVEILRGQDWQRVLQSSQQVDEQRPESIRIATSAETLRFVSRGGLKLEGALQAFNLKVEGLRALDLGLSTGGFADCLLQKGAKEICGVDVGHGQLDRRLVDDRRLLAFDGVNVRDLASHHEVMAWIRAGVDLCVVDLSFISLSLVVPVLSQVLPVDCQVLALLKPQFEVGREKLDPSLFPQVQKKIMEDFANQGFSELNIVPSRVRGQDGNQEFFIFARR